MKRSVYLILLALLTTLNVNAQDFELYYSKDINDVANVTTNVDELAKQLTWRKIDNNSIDGNQDEVRKVVEMFDSPQMKGRDEQQMFWKMRDHTLLCFRINDGGGKTGSYHVEVNYGKDQKGNDVTKSLTTSKYFFVNMPHQEEEITITVYRVGNKNNAYKFRYWVYDWNDDNVYIFQLDQKRQSSGDTYKMEYTTSYNDESGELHDVRKTLELKETYFQSFYVPEGHTLTDMYFLTGNDAEGDVKLKVKLDELHSGIDLDSKFDVHYLSSAFFLAKHENRELMNFNWMGTGLFEKYDTLYMKLFCEGAEITNARINVHRVDKNGNLVKDDGVGYYGYDYDIEYHRILTFGHPALIEIIADGCLPSLYRYKGAADADSKVVNPELCTAKLTLRAGSYDEDEIAISDQHLRYMKNENIVAVRNNVDHFLCTIDDVNLGVKNCYDTLVFADDCATHEPKLLNNEPTEHFAEVEVSFSSPKGGSNPKCELSFTDVQNNQRYVPTEKEIEVISSSEFTHFSRDYYFVRSSVVNVLPYNKACTMNLNAEGKTYDDFPMLMSMKYDPDEIEKDAQEKAKQITETKDDTDKIADADTESKTGFTYPATFKFALGPMTIKTGFTFDIAKQTLNVFCMGMMNSSVENEQNKEEITKVRDQAKLMQGYNYRKFKANPQSEDKDQFQGDVSLNDQKMKYDDWVMSQTNDIFAITPGHMGFYYGGGFKSSFNLPMSNPKLTQIQEFSAYIEGGAGAVWTPDSTKGALQKVGRLLEKVWLHPDIGMVFDANLKLEGGMMTFNSNYPMSGSNTGIFNRLGFSVRLGAWMGINASCSIIGSLKTGVRAGSKGSIEGGIAVPFNFSNAGYGSRAMLLAMVEAYVHLRLVCFSYNGSVYARVGKQWLWPDDPINPFHDDFPKWLTSKSSTRSVANSFKRLSAPAPNALGSTLFTGVACDANPHFLSPQEVVFNHLQNAADYNDDNVTLLNINDNTEQTLSLDGKTATQSMRSKFGNSEVVVFQQYTSTFNNEAINDENAVSASMVQQSHTQIKASFKQADGTWKMTDVTPDDGMIDQQPMVTIQEDGKAACIYQHGEMTLIDQTVSADSAFNHRLQGKLMLRTYDGTKWSEATPLFDINPDNLPTHYDLVMRNDTVLVGVNMTNEEMMTTTMQYASKPLASDKVSYVEGDLNPIDFFLNRVGKHTVIAGLHQRSDSIRDVYIKTLSMDGKADGFAGCDLGLSRSNPERVKIICDRSDVNTEDFAVLWTESGNVIHDAAAGNSATQDMGTMLNASRIHLDHTPGIAYPLTMGGETDGLALTDFDGYLDDNRINVVYTLSDLESGGAVIMQNEKYFVNSFESDVTYTHEHILASSSLPVNVWIRNTGVSTINSAVVNINGEDIEIPNVIVNPLQENNYVVNYPIPDNFDGYMSSSVTVTYDNEFKASHAPAFGPYRARSMRRQTKAFDRERVGAGDIDCNVVSSHISDDGMNTFVVEVIDRSSRGLMSGTGVSLGVYSSPIFDAPINGEAMTIVNADEFKMIGGVRKAYSTVSISGITEPISGYIVPNIVDFETTESGHYRNIHNVRRCNNSPYVNLYPSGDPTKIIRPKLSKEPLGHKVKLSSREDGIELSGLTVGDEVRVFENMGIPVYVGKATASTLFIPINRQGVFVLNAGGEVFKFLF